MSSSTAASGAKSSSQSLSCKASTPAVSSLTTTHNSVATVPTRTVLNFATVTFAPPVIRKTCWLATMVGAFGTRRSFSASPVYRFMLRRASSLVLACAVTSGPSFSTSVIFAMNPSVSSLLLWWEVATFGM